MTSSQRASRGSKQQLGLQGASTRGFKETLALSRPDIRGHYDRLTLGRLELYSCIIGLVKPNTKQTLATRAAKPRTTNICERGYT